MVKLNLEAKDQSQELIKAYLENNASDILADKINNGVTIEKDGKRLINKKDINGFMAYACGEARKLAEKGANSACVECTTVYGWAIHYFEEDSIQGKLYNQDGTEYKPPAPVKKDTPKPATPIPPPKPKAQFSFFDMLNEQKEVELQADDHEVVDKIEEEPTVEQIADKIQQDIDKKRDIKPKKNYPQFYTQYLEMKEAHPDSIIIARLGDFYEAFGSDAEILADELNLTMTGRKLTDDERVPMVGFPYHVSDNYFAKIQTKHNITIIDFNGEIITLNKTSAPICKDDLLDDEYIDDLTEEEMRQFDGDIEEPESIPKSILSEEQKDEMKFVLTKDDIVNEPSVLKKLHEILGNVLA